MPALTPETAAERRDHLLTAAMRCFARGGYRGTTMRDIAQEAGVTTGAIYAHFDGKEDLLTALARKFESERAEVLAVPGPTVPVPRAVGRTLERLTAYLDEEGAEEALYSDLMMMAEALNVPELRRHLVATDRQHFTGIEEILRRNRKWKKGVRPGILSRVVTGSLFGLLVLRAYHPDLDRKKYIACLRALVEGAMAPPDDA